MNDPVMQQNPSLDVASPKKPEMSNSRSLLLYATVALGIALFIRFFVAEPFLVYGSSMEPTFYNMHYLIVDRVSYKVGDPMRGDVVVFDLPGTNIAEGKSLIKRIIGLPGETVKIRGNDVIIVNDEHPDGITLDEPYLDPNDLGGPSGMTTTLGENEYFVLGDNRHVSSDSRIWGTLPRKDIVGRVFLRLYPFNDIGVLPGEARYTEN